MNRCAILDHDRSLNGPLSLCEPLPSRQRAGVQQYVGWLSVCPFIERANLRPCCNCFSWLVGHSYRPASSYTIAFHTIWIRRCSDGLGRAAWPSCQGPGIIDWYSPTNRKELKNDVTIIYQATDVHRRLCGLRRSIPWVDAGGFDWSICD